MSFSPYSTPRNPFGAAPLEDERWKDDDQPMFQYVKELGWHPSPRDKSSRVHFHDAWDDGDERRQSPAFLPLPSPTTGSGPPLAITNSPHHAERARSSPFSNTGTPHPRPRDARPSKTPPTATTADFPSNPKTPYEVLGIREDASQEEIRKAYKMAALRHHPDLCRGSEAEKELAKRRFQMIGEAFAILGDPSRRAEYDRARRERTQARPPPRAPSSRPTPAPSTPSFRSSFVPETASVPRARGGPNDLRNVDPFVLFNRIFGDISQGYADRRDVDPDASTRMRSRRPGGQHQSRQNLWECLSGDTAVPVPGGSNRTSSLNEPTKGKPFKMHESHESAHINRHGVVNIQKSEKSMRVSKNGAVSFESHSFSTSFGGGKNGQGSMGEAFDGTSSPLAGLNAAAAANLEMMQSLMAGFGFGGNTMPSFGGGPVLAQQPLFNAGGGGSRNRRQSLSSLASGDPSAFGNARPAQLHRQNSLGVPSSPARSSVGWGASPTPAAQVPSSQLDLWDPVSSRSPMVSHGGRPSSSPSFFPVDDGWGSEW